MIVFYLGMLFSVVVLFVVELRRGIRMAIPVFVGFLNQRNPSVRRAAITGLSALAEHGA